MSNIADRVRIAQDKDGMLRRALERIIQLYTDKSHFVYELLQNAEDAEAKDIKFIQHADHLEVLHDGKPFTSANLQGLCDIGKSDKVDNLNQIGEFGVGFKSVFGICDTVLLYSKALARRMGELGFSEHLIMGKGDIQNNINQEDSVKEDLFEAIIGAVAIDSGWNLKDLQKVVEVMLVPEDFLINDTDTNYVRLIQEWEMNENGCIPWYKYKEASYSSTWYLKEDNTIYQSFPLDYNCSKLKYHCYLKLLDSLPVFCGFGVSIREARMAACKLAYEYLERNDMLPSIRDEIENPNRDDAINQLETLARRGYFSIPTYEFKETYDNNGNPIWNCECRIAEKDYYFDGTSSSKKEAKKDSAFRMLFYVLGMEDE